MANHTSLASLFSDIADAIRAKTGGSSNIIADNFPTAISQIPTGGSASLGTKTITANGTYDAEDDGYDGYSSVDVNVSGGGGGGLTLLTEQSLGNLSTSSTTAVDTTKVVTLSDVDDYDILIVETSVDSITNGNHVATVGVVFLTGNNTVENKTSSGQPGAKSNFRSQANGDIFSAFATTAYGVYPYTATMSNGVLTMKMYMRYHSTYTGTINGRYTTRVYGINLYDLIGG